MNVHINNIIDDSLLNIPNIVTFLIINDFWILFYRIYIHTYTYTYIYGISESISKYALITTLVRRSMNKSTLVVVGILVVALIVSALPAVPMQEAIAQDTTFDFKQDQQNRYSALLNVVMKAQ